MITLEDIKRLIQQEDDVPTDVVDFFELEEEQEPEPPQKKSGLADLWNWMRGQ
mgnify:FL=1